MKKEKKVETKTRSVKITFGFGTNKYGYPKVYRRGKGKDLHEAIINLFRQRGNNFLPPEQRAEILTQLKRTAEITQNESYVHLDQRRENAEKS